MGDVFSGGELSYLHHLHSTSTGVRFVLGCLSECSGGDSETWRFLCARDGVLYGECGDGFDSYVEVQDAYARVKYMARFGETGALRTSRRAGVNTRLLYHLFSIHITLHSLPATVTYVLLRITVFDAFSAGGPGRSPRI